jgi:ATP-binding cassette subfamily F protein 3
MFLHSIARRLIVFQEDTVTLFEGPYSEFLNRGGWLDEETLQEAPAEENEASPAMSRKALKRERSRIINAKSRALRPLKKRVAQAETAIEREENSLAELNKRLVEASQRQDGKKISSLSRSAHECQAEIDKLYTALEVASQEYDTLEAQYNEQLEALE